MRDGILLIDKHSGPTSADIVAIVKKHLRLKKVGHAGTLDPLATGLLVILLGHATRLQFLFMECLKIYEGVIRLGVATDTDDITGTIIASIPDVALALQKDLSNCEVQTQLTGVLKGNFLGESLQQPPIYSARKIDGERSYALARSGRAVLAESKRIRIEEFQLRFIQENRLWYRIRCSKGTYIRALARDIGMYLGVPACLESIRRVFSEPFAVEEAVTVEELKTMGEGIARRILSLEAVLSALPRILLNPSQCATLLRGDQRVLRNMSATQDHLKPTAQKNENIAAVFDVNGTLVGVVEKDPHESQRAESSDNTKNEWRVRFLVSSPVSLHD